MYQAGDRIIIVRTWNSLGGYEEQDVLNTATVTHVDEDVLYADTFFETLQIPLDAVHDDTVHFKQVRVCMCEICQRRRSPMSMTQ